MLINEFDARIEMVRGDLMTPRDIDLLLIYSADVFNAGNVRYLTNFDAYASYGMVMLPRAGELSLAVGFHHSAYLVRVKHVARAGYITGTKTPATHAFELMDELGITSPRIGLVGCHDMFQSIRHDLEKELPAATFLDLTGDYERLRGKKSAAEMRCLRRSASIADQALRTIEDHLQAGRTELGVVAEGGLSARRAGADVLTREMVGFLVASGDPILRFPGPATSRKLREGDWFAVEVSPSFEGYRAVLGRTFAIGKPGAPGEELNRRVAQVHRQICELIQPGSRTHEIALEAEALLRKKGLLDYVVRSVGHGIGLDPEEPPRLDLDDPTTLETGMALAVRTAVARPDAGGAFFADTILVGEDQAEKLSKV